MTTVLKKKFTKNDLSIEILDGIIKLASDKNIRLLADDDIEWKQTKLKEIARLGRILRNNLEGLL